MSTGKKFGLFVVGFLLVATVGAANLSYTLDRTVLDADYVSNNAEEEGTYAWVADDLTQSFSSDLEGVDPTASQQLPTEIDVGTFDPDEIADEAVTEEYVAGQSESALRSLYSYLHGESDELELVIDTEPLKENAAEAIADRATSVDAAEMVQSVDSQKRIKDSVRRTIEDTNQNVDPGQIADEINPSRLLEGEQGFEQETSDFDALANRAGISPSAIDRFESDAKRRIEQETQAATSQYSQNVTDATTEMQFALVEAYTTDMTYSEFTSRIESSERRLTEEVGRLAIQEMDEQVDDRIALSELLSQDDQGTIQEEADRAAGPVQRNDTAKTVLPILALLFVGIAYGISRSVHTTGRVTGVALVVAGVAGFVGAMISQSIVTDRLEGSLPADAPQEASDTLVSLVEGVMGTLSAQSLVLGFAGLLVVGLVYADESGRLDGVKGKVGGDAGRGGGGQRAQNQQYGRQQGHQQQGGQQQGGHQQQQEGSGTEDQSGTADASSTGERPEAGGSGERTDPGETGSVNESRSGDGTEEN